MNQTAGAILTSEVLRYSFTLNSWIDFVPDEPLPTLRIFASCVIDKDNQIIVFGGDLSGSGPYQNDIWRLTIPAPVITTCFIDRFSNLDYNNHL